MVEAGEAVTEEMVGSIQPQKGTIGPFKKHRKELISDSEVTEDIQDSLLFFQKRLERVFGVNRCFTRVSFKQSIIYDCYFRNCEFVKCNFIGAQFSGSNFQGTKFDGCDFSYATFERTDVDPDILKKNLPPYENIKRDLARSLRTNYASMGNYDGVNVAILIELAATLEHYRKVAFSAESYYRNKYKGLRRVIYVWKYASFWALDKLWGNGERPWQLVWIASGAWIFGAAYGVVFVDLSFVTAATASASAFILGNESELGSAAAILLGLVRYLILGMFLASLVKRLARR